MLTLGILLTVGVLLQMLLFGWQNWMAAVLAASAIAVLTGIPAVKLRLGSGNRGRIIAAATFAVLVSAALGGPALMEKDGPEHVDNVLKRSADLIAAGDFNKAETLLRRLAADYPDFPEVRLNLSTTYLEEKKPLKAARVLDESGEYRLFDAPRLFNYAMAYYQQRDYGETLVHLNRALRQDAGMAEAWLYASECALRQDDLKAARYYTDQLVLMRPDMAAAHVQKARVHLTAMEYQEALAELDEARKLEADKGLSSGIERLEREAKYYVDRIKAR